MVVTWNEFAQMGKLTWELPKGQIPGNLKEPNQTKTTTVEIVPKSYP